jgi:hypothetical protein
MGKYFCRFELENMSIYEILPALDPTMPQYPSESECTGEGGSNLKFPEYP